MTFAEFNVQMTAIVGAVFLWCAHHGELFLMDFFSKRNDWGRDTSASCAGSLEWIFGKVGLHFTGALVLEIAALVFFTFALRDNADDRSASMQDNSSIESLGSNEFKWLLVWGVGSAIVGRTGILLIHGHKTDLIGGSAHKIAAFVASQGLYWFGWALLGLAAAIDKESSIQYVAGFGAGLIGTSSTLLSLLHWGRSQGPYDGPAAKFGNIFVRMIWNTGGVFLFTWACIEQVESA